MVWFGTVVSGQLSQYIYIVKNSVQFSWAVQSIRPKILRIFRVLRHQVSASVSANIKQKDTRFSLILFDCSL